MFLLRIIFSVEWYFVKSTNWDEEPITNLLKFSSEIFFGLDTIDQSCPLFFYFCTL